MTVKGKMWLIILVLLVMVNTVTCYWMMPGRDLENLVMLHVLFRHGDRTPDHLEVYPKDPYRNLTYWPVGYGELTNEGKLKEYHIGKALRKTYNKFLDIYTPNVLEARTTDYNRTKMSCELVLAGMYPPSTGQIWARDINWQPIPYNYEPTAQDHLLGDPRFNCPNYIQLYNEFLVSPTGMTLNVNNGELYDYLSYNTGWNIQTTYSVYNLYFVLFAEESLGFKLPDWTTPVWPRKITEVAIREYHVSNATPQMKKLAAGRLLKKIITDTILKIEGRLVPKGRKVFLYSAHENNLANILILLNVFHPHVPPYGAYLVMEVHRINGIYGFKVYYQDYRGAEPKLLTLPGCSEFCPLSKFIKLVEEYLPTDGNVCGNETVV